MGLPVFYVPAEHIDQHTGMITLPHPDSRHLTRSLRAKEGDLVTIGDGLGTLYETKLGPTMSETVRCVVSESTYYPPERPQFVLFQGMSKSQATDDAITLAAESGAARMVIFEARRSPYEAAKKAGNRLERWQSIAREASKRARRAWPLEIRQPVAGFIDKALMETVNECVVLWEDEEQRRYSATLPEAAPVSLALVVGPEGGLEPHEIDVLRTLGARTASLGSNNIRTQSAGAFAVMLGRDHYGLLSPEAPSDA